jgi:2-polyprenyl-6-methoxyphenol hydroxylase-like FAD-dependent oxidoreductase
LVVAEPAPDEVPVLIVGGSLAGLSTALFLGRHGVPSFLVERHSGTAIHPRAAHFSQRTIELYREAGLEDEIMAAAEREFVQNGAIMSVESLAGKELDWYFRNINEGFEDLSPSRRLFITQIGLEPILRRRAAELGASLSYGWELTSLDASDGANEAVVVDRDRGEERRLRARYVVAADGPRSGIRERLGIAMEGRGSFSNSVTIYFRADVRPLIGDRNLSVVYVFNPQLVGFFRFSKAGDAGFLVVNRLVGEDGVRTTDVSALADEERCIGWVRLALGAPDLPIEIENVQNWVALADSAGEYRCGNVFIAGDAAHTMPPTGGFGGTRASRTRTTWRGRSRRCSTARPARRCSTPTTASAGRSARRSPSRRTRATSSASTRSSAPTTSRR